MRRWTRTAPHARLSTLGIGFLIGCLAILVGGASSASVRPVDAEVLAAAATPKPTATRVTRTTPTPSLTATAVPTSGPSFAYKWVENYRLTELWSGPEGLPDVTSFGTTDAQFCAFQVLEPQTSSRLLVYNPAKQAEVWIDAQAVGAIVAPERRLGPAPAEANCSGAVYEPAGVPVDQRLVVALYYAWFDQSTWTSGMTEDAPTVPYRSDDPTTIERQLAWAKQAGIDVFAQAWYGPRDNNPTEKNFRTLLASAERAGMRAALLFETDSEDWFPDRGAMVTALRHFLRVHAEHPGYLRVNGRPVILVWHPYTAFGPDGQRVNDKSQAAVDAWASLIQEVDPQHQAMWIAEGDYFPMLEVFDGIFPYSIAWSPDPPKQLRSYSERVRAFNEKHDTRKLWAATAMPGYDDRAIPGRADAFAVGRAEGGYYRSTFRGAIYSEPSWVVITSWNEWLEGTQVEPSSSYGMRYLDITREMAQWFKRRN